jgi:hypothetical protein
VKKGNKIPKGFGFGFCSLFLHLRTFKTPPKGAVMSDEGDADWASKMPNGVKAIGVKIKNVLIS